MSFVDFFYLISGGHFCSSEHNFLSKFSKGPYEERAFV